MIEIVLAADADPAGVEGPIDFARDVRGSCLIRDMDAGALLGWADLGVCSLAPDHADPPLPDADRPEAQPPEVARPPERTTPPAVAVRPGTTETLPTPERKPDPPAVTPAREPGIYMAVAAGRRAAIGFGMVEVVEGTGAASGPRVFGTDVRGGCLMRDVPSGHRLSWDDIGSC